MYRNQKLEFLGNTHQELSTDNMISDYLVNIEK